MNRGYFQKAIIAHALNMIPPLIRTTLLDDTAFRKENGLSADAVLTFDESGISFQRSALYNAIRKALNSTSPVQVNDLSEQMWELSRRNDVSADFRLILKNNDSSLTLPEYFPFYSDRGTRLRRLNEIAFDVNLPIEEIEKWQTILSSRMLEDEEIDLLDSDIMNTPVNFIKSLHKEIARKNVRISTLVPSSRVYYERLVGKFDGSSTLHDYARSSGDLFVKQLRSWRPYDGFLFSLLLSSNFLLTDRINFDQLSVDDVIRAYTMLVQSGDRISQLGAIEVGLRFLSSYPEIEPFIIQLVEQIRDDDVDTINSKFKLLSSLFILVDGELSRTRMFANEGTFYRRLASLGHASLICREFETQSINIDSFNEWVLSYRGEQFYLQSLADMQLEPRWSPDYAAALHLKANFIGRIISTAMEYEQKIKKSNVTKLILGSDRGSLLSISNFSYTLIPGPLGSKGFHFLPSELSMVIETQLDAVEVTPSSFIALVNSAPIFQLDSSLPEKAATKIKNGGYRLINIEDREQLIAVINGLATVAAVTRSTMLADEIRILVRKYRYDTQYGLSIEEIIRICLVASSSNLNTIDWTRFVGDWFTELAFGTLEGDDGELLYSYLQGLCHVVPELWIYCGRADAALMAYNASK